MSYKRGDTIQTAASKHHGGIALYKDILANVSGEMVLLHAKVFPHCFKSWHINKKAVPFLRKARYAAKKSTI